MTRRLQNIHRLDHRRRQPRRWRRWMAGVMLTPGVLLFTAWLALPLVPLPGGLLQPPRPGVEFVDRNGQPLRPLPGDEGQFTRSTTFSEVPLALVHATVAAEDKRFWTHPGVDIRATARAAWSLVRHRRVVSGASTITQQLIKQAQPRPRTLRTKLIESAQALRLEQMWDKQRIFAEYVNRVDYGNLNAGCGQAARFYFGKPLQELSAAECALLAGLPQSPSRLNPLKHPERAQRRQRWILQRMRELGFLTEAEHARAVLEPLRLARVGRAFEAPHFIDLLLAEVDSETVRGVSEKCAPNLAPRPRFPLPALPRQIRTSIDLGLNRFVTRVLREQLANLESQETRNGAVVIIDNRTAEVLALVGSEDYFAPAEGQVNGAWARRSPGSALKPFTYLLAFERGTTPATVLADVPSVFATPTGEFAPVNFDRIFRGPVRARIALANSLNVPAVRLLDELGGPAPLQERLRWCGLTTLEKPADYYGLGLTIGNAEVRLLELANAYACLARLGEYRPFRLFTDGSDSREAHGTRLNSPALSDSSPLNGERAGVRGEKGREPSRWSGGRRARQLPGIGSEAKRVGDARAAWLIADILSDNDARAAAFGLNSSLRFDFPVACKTGTSSDFRDNWAFGYTPEFTVGVWVGNFDGTPMQRVSGVTGAGPLLHAIFVHLHERFETTWFERPAGIVERAIHPVTGRSISDSFEPPFGNRSPEAVPSGTGLQPADRGTGLQPVDRETGLQPVMQLVSPPTHAGVGGTSLAIGFASEASDETGSPPIGLRGDLCDGLQTRSTAPWWKGRSPRQIVETFLADVLPAEGGPDDFDDRGRVKLESEYREWLNAPTNPRHTEFVLRGDHTAIPLRILSPVPGATYFLDPDLPESGSRIPLKAAGGSKLRWKSNSLRVDANGESPCAVLLEGRHELVVWDENNGRIATTWIDVKRL